MAMTPMGPMNALPPKAQPADTGNPQSAFPHGHRLSITSYCPKCGGSADVAFPGGTLQLRCKAGKCGEETTCHGWDERRFLSAVLSDIQKQVGGLR